MLTDSARSDADKDVRWPAWPEEGAISERRRVDRVRLAVSIGLLFVWLLVKGF
jgi:hypothetical protein